MTQRVEMLSRYSADDRTAWAVAIGWIGAGAGIMRVAAAGAFDVLGEILPYPERAFCASPRADIIRARGQGEGQMQSTIRKVQHDTAPSSPPAEAAESEFSGPWPKVRVIAFQKDGRDYAHAQIARAIHATAVERLRGGHGVEDLVICHSQEEVEERLRERADVVVVVCHSIWEECGTPAERWTGLLGTDRDRLAGLVDAGCAVFVSCHLYDEPGLADIAAHPMPVAACASTARFKYSPLIIGPLLYELVRRGRPADWSLALRDALETAKAEARTLHPNTPQWNYWSVRQL